MEFLTLKDYLELDFPPVEFIKTGAKNFDNIVGGILKGGITVIAGGSGQGKSMVGLHLASLLSKENKVLYASMENDVRIDLKRFNDVLSKKIYDININNINYVNAGCEIDENNMLLSNKDIFNNLINEIPNYDIVVIDGLDLLVDLSEDGAELYKNGNLLMKLLHKSLKENGLETAIIITWQMNRNANVKKIEELNQYAIGTSMGIIRYASHVYGVCRFENNWYLKLMKSRTEFNIDASYIDILDQYNNINLNNALQKKEVNEFIDDLKNLANKFTNGKE